MAPGFTELDEIAEYDQRRRAWRDYLDRQRALGSPALQELLDAGVKPADLDRRVRHGLQLRRGRVPRGRGAAAGSGAGARGARAASGRSSTRCCPARSIPTPRARSSRPCASSPGGSGWRRSTSREWSPSSSPNGTSEPDIVQKWWADDNAGKKAAKAKIEELFAEFHARRPALPRGLVPVRLPPRADPADRGPRVRRPGAPPRRHAQLRRPAPVRRHLAPRQPGGARRAPAEVPLALRGRVPGHGPDPGRGDPAAGGRAERGAGLDARAPAAGRAVRGGRSEAVHLPLPSGGHRDLPARAAAHRSDRRPGRDAHRVLPLRPRALRVGECAPSPSSSPSRPRRISRASPGSRRPATRRAPRSASASSRSPRRSRGRRRRAVRRRRDRPLHPAPRWTRGRRKPGDFLILTRTPQGAADLHAGARGPAPARRGERRRGLRQVVGRHRAGRSAARPHRSRRWAGGRRRAARTALRRERSRAVPASAGRLRLPHHRAQPGRDARTGRRGAARPARDVRLDAQAPGAGRRRAHPGSDRPPGADRRGEPGRRRGGRPAARGGPHPPGHRGGRHAGRRGRGADPRIWSPPRSNPCRSSPAAPTSCA